MLNIHSFKNRGITALLCCLLGFASCKQINQSISDTFKGEPKEKADPLSGLMDKNPVTKKLTERKTGFISDTAYLQKAENELRNLSELKNKSITLYQMVYFYGDGRISVKIQDSANPKYINEYWYKKGTWQQPQPVQLSRRNEEMIPKALFPLDSLPFVTASKVWETYNQKAVGIEGAKPATNVYFIFRKDSNYSCWYPTSISGSRESWDIWFDRKGKVVLFERN